MEIVHDTVLAALIAHDGDRWDAIDDDIVDRSRFIVQWRSLFMILYLYDGNRLRFARLACSLYRMMRSCVCNQTLLKRRMSSYLVFVNSVMDAVADADNYADCAPAFALLRCSCCWLRSGVSTTIAGWCASVECELLFVTLRHVLRRLRSCVVYWVFAAAIAIRAMLSGIAIRVLLSGVEFVK